MAYSELIKSFEKIRDYMREFYVYGFKSRDGYTKKSARSYDDERRRIESWLGGYMAFRRTPEGKSVFISVDNRSVTFNPLYNAWKAKSFTDRDIVLHFCLLDLLADGEPLSAGEITDGLARLLAQGETPFEIDESTVRKKVKEYTQLGLLESEKAGRTVRYRLAEDRVPLRDWEDAAAFFSEEAPFGVVGSYLLDRLPEAPEHFRYKHHYLLHTLDTQILYEILCAMKEKRCADLVIFNGRRTSEREHRVCPLRIYVSTQTGREYLLGYHCRFCKPMFFRLDTIRTVKAGPAEKKWEEYMGYAETFDKNLWGVSTGGEYNIDHVEMTVHVGRDESFILDRLQREKRHGRIEKLDEETYRFTADVYDAGELLPWVRSFIGRVIRFDSSSRSAVERFYRDLRRMEELYGEGVET